MHFSCLVVIEMLSCAGVNDILLSVQVVYINQAMYNITRITVASCWPPNGAGSALVGRASSPTPTFFYGLRQHALSTHYMCADRECTWPATLGIASYESSPHCSYHNLDLKFHTHASMPTHLYNIPTIRKRRHVTNTIFTSRAQNPAQQFLPF